MLVAQALSLSRLTPRSSLPQTTSTKFPLRALCYTPGTHELYVCVSLLACIPVTYLYLII